jgi:hypothetical protein
MEGISIMKLKDQVALITGAGRNIGKAMAKLFASEGAKIIVAEMHEARGQAVVDEINKSGAQASLVLGDVSKSADVQRMVKEAVGKFGAIDILVNNAALTDHANIFDSTEEEFEGTVSGDEVCRCPDEEPRARWESFEFRFDIGISRAFRWYRVRGGQSRRNQHDACHGGAAG